MKKVFSKYKEVLRGQIYTTVYQLAIVDIYSKPYF